MSEEKKLNTLPQQPEEQEIDLIELAKKVWAERKLVFKACGYAALIGLVVAFSIPREYYTSVTLAPESTGKTSGGSMGALYEGLPGCTGLAQERSDGRTLPYDVFQERTLLSVCHRLAGTEPWQDCGSRTGHLLS